MEEEIGKLDQHQDDSDEIFTKAVKAGKRTYFFDVKATKGLDYYLTITESKKKLNADGTFFFEKHKIFLYKEDFEKFAGGLNEAILHIKGLTKGGGLSPITLIKKEKCVENSISYTNVEFEDLDKI